MDGDKKDVITPSSDNGSGARYVNLVEKHFTPTIEEKQYAACLINAVNQLTACPIAQVNIDTARKLIDEMERLSPIISQFYHTR